MKLPAVSLLALSLSAALNPALAHKPVVPDVDPQRLSQDVKVLSSDEFEGRGPATAGETKTIDYVVAQLKAAGVQPGGDLKDGKREWTQAVPLARSQIRGTPTLSVAVKGRSQPLTQGEQPKPTELGSKDDFQLQQALAFLKGEPVKSASPTVAQTETPKPQVQTR